VNSNSLCRKRAELIRALGELSHPAVKPATKDPACCLAEPQFISVRYLSKTDVLRILNLVAVERFQVLNFIRPLLRCD
jgi:hypothetical protein